MWKINEKVENLFQWNPMESNGKIDNPKQPVEADKDKDKDKDKEKGKGKDKIKKKKKEKWKKKKKKEKEKDFKNQASPWITF